MHIINQTHVTHCVLKPVLFVSTMYIAVTIIYTIKLALCLLNKLSRTSDLSDLWCRLKLKNLNDWWKCNFSLTIFIVCFVCCGYNTVDFVQGV